MAEMLQHEPASEPLGLPRDALGTAQHSMSNSVAIAEDAFDSADQELRSMRQRLDAEWAELEADREDLAVARARVREQLEELGRRRAGLEEEHRELNRPK